MEVKIDTKEKFTVVTPVTANLSANIAAELISICNDLLHQPVKNVILNMSEAATLDPSIAGTITDLQQQFYEKSASFVICNLSDAAAQTLDQLELTELLNITPTESEAWDIVQMEEIERELLDGDDVNFETND
ncbi:MAG: anti-sigma factor antagonist [Sphingobacteriia bacterium]|nr:anti-sigma factor antagonist [Sphingobacteriia bacterium]